MSNAWETTTDDVENVFRRRGKPIERDTVVRIHGALDHDLIEREALAGDDIEEQTGYAYDEIEKQIKGNETL